MTTHSQPPWQVRLYGDLDDPEVVHCENGATLICRLPEVGKKAYLHALFPALDFLQSAAIDADDHGRFPQHYSEFLRESNGAILFQGALALYGIRAGWTRDVDSRQPFDWSERNIHMRPAGARPDHFFIGSYNWDGSLLYLAGDEPAVFRRSPEDPRPLNSWRSIPELLEREVARIGSLFDARGREINDRIPTSPSPQAL